MKVIVHTNADGSVAVTSFNWTRRAKEKARALADHEQKMVDWAQRVEACRQAKDSAGAAEPAPIMPDVLTESDDAFIQRQAAKRGVSGFIVLDHDDLPPASETIKDAKGNDLTIDLQQEWKIEAGQLNAKGRSDKVAANKAARDAAK